MFETFSNKRQTLVAGLLYLQHTYGLFDEEVVWGWLENRYWQLFYGETWFQRHPPIDPTEFAYPLTGVGWRMGKGGMEWLLAQTICVAQSAKLIKRQSLDKLIGQLSGIKVYHPQPQARHR